jgi:hypothetical protein
MLDLEGREGRWLTYPSPLHPLAKMFFKDYSAEGKTAWSGLEGCTWL